MKRIAVLKLVSLAAVAMLLTGCGSAKLAAIAQEGTMSIEFDGKELPLAVEVMDIYLVDPDYEDQYPETFSVHGPDFDLVGSFPQNLRVGYGADYSQMIGRTVDISPRAEIYYEQKRSRIKSLGIAGEVESGTLVVDRVLGQNPEGAGQILEGKIELELGGDRTVSGTFTFLAKTWG